MLESRRKFLKSLGKIVVVASAGAVVSGCEVDSISGGGFSLLFVTGNMDDSGHQHIFIIDCSDLTAGADKTYTALGLSARHTHPVTITASQFATINGGGTVTIMTVDQHPHTWTISKAANVC